MGDEPDYPEKQTPDLAYPDHDLESLKSFYARAIADDPQEVFHYSLREDLRHYYERELKRIERARENLEALIAELTRDDT